MTINKKIFTIIITISIISLVLLYIYLNFSSSLEKYGDINVEEAKYLIESNPNLVIVDVRTAEEYESGHIEKAINLSVANPEVLVQSLNPNDEILLYCRTANRSATAMQILRENGYDKVYNMLGGIVAWINMDYPVV